MHSLRLNGEYLAMDGGGVTYPEGFTVKVLASGTQWGNAEPLLRTLNTLASSGSWEVVQRFGNRLPSLSIQVTAPDPTALNDGEKWLSELMRPGALEWLPPMSDVWTVFDVVSATLERAQDDDWDLDELRFTRTYRVPIRALPHARSADQVVTPAEADALDVVIDDGSSTVGWSADGTLSVASGAVVNTYDATADGFSHMRLTEPIDLTGTPFIQIDWKPSRAVYHTFRTSAGVIPQARKDVLANGYTRSYYRVPDDVTSLSWIQLDTVHPAATAAETTRVDQVRRLSRMPFSATTRQKTTAIYPGGSAPAEGDLHVYHPTSALGRTIVHTYPMGRPSPALMQYLQTSATPVADGTTLNGEYIPIMDEQAVLNVPDLALPTRGLASVWAKIQVNGNPLGSSTAVTIKWRVMPWCDGNLIGPWDEGYISIQPAEFDRILIPVALVTLPPRVTGPMGSTVFTFERTEGTASVYLDEVWAFGQDEESALTIVDCGEGAPAPGESSNRLWVNAPTPEAPAGQVLVGTSLDDARWPQTLQSSQLHKFPPQGVSVLVATTNALDPAVELSHYRRWTHHAGD